MPEREFSLLEEPWIIVMKSNGQIAKVSLTQALLQAHKIRDLAGESKTQDAAILRLLLAVLHATFGQNGEFQLPSQAMQFWGELWHLKQFPAQPIQAYLTRWQDRFWLFDLEHPFYQIPNLNGTENPAKKLNGALVESNNKVQLFSLQSGERKNQLAFDEAARWLVHIQGFGDCAAKKPSPKLSWLGSIGLITAKGNTLFETLMFNFILLKDGMEPWGLPEPIWELPQHSGEKLREIAMPDNQSELLTMQCRRILLRREQNLVVGYTEAAGDHLEGENAFGEQMTLWREIKERTAIVGYRPRVHQASRQLWRDFSVIMGQTTRKPGLVLWIERLKKANWLEKSRLVSFETCGVQYGNMTCGIADEFFDRLQLHIGLLEELGQKWQRMVADEVERCDQLAQAVGRLGYRVDLAIGGNGQSASRSAQEQCYYRLDLPFRQWLLTIDPESTLWEQRNLRMYWRKQAKSIALRLGHELVEQGGTIALVGRSVTEHKGRKESTTYYCAPKAFNQFLYEVTQWEGTKP